MFVQSFRPAGERNGNGNGHGHGEALLHAEDHRSRIPAAQDRHSPRAARLARPVADHRPLGRRAARGHPPPGRRHAPAPASRKLPAIDEERLVDELIAESFGLGPLEPYMQDPDVTRHPGQRPARGLCRAARPPARDEHRLCRRRAPAADHPADRRPRRPPHRRAFADGRCPPARRQPRQRHHSAAGPARAGALDSPLRPPPAASRRPARPRLGLPRNAAGARSGHRRPHQHHDQRRHRQRQNDAAQQPLEVHPGQRTAGDDRRLGRTACCSGSTSSSWKRGPRAPKAPAKSRSATWCATPSACVPTGSSSAKSAAAKPSTCSRP